MRSVEYLRSAAVAALVGIFGALAAVPAQAIVITVDPGPVGSTMAPQTIIDLPDLIGPVADGLVTVDIFWTDGKYLDFAALNIFNLILDLDFSNASGSFGSGIGALFDENGDAIPGAVIGTITSAAAGTVNLFGTAPDPLVYGVRHLFSLNGADVGTTITAATLTFYEGNILIGQSATQVPEPATLALFGSSVLLGFAALRRERRRRAA